MKPSFSLHDPTWNKKVLRHSESCSVFTDANLYKHKNVDVITMCADRTFEIAMAQDIDLPSYTELALEIMDGRSSGL